MDEEKVNIDVKDLPEPTPEEIEAVAEEEEEVEEEETDEEDIEEGA